MTTVASAALFRSESKGSGFHANERPQLSNVLISKNFKSHASLTFEQAQAKTADELSYNYTMRSISYDSIQTR